MNISIQFRCFVTKIAAILVFAILFSQDVSGQIQVTNGFQEPFDVESLIRDVFQGDGIEIVSVTFNGDSISLGYFDSAVNDIGIDEGFLLTTGSYYDKIARANNMTTTSGEHSTMPEVTDLDLAELRQSVIGDVTKIEIEFIPRGDEISFNYVFGSEEYPEFSCTTSTGREFYDGIGLFLSGDGISGGNRFQNDAINIGTLPNGDPVSVNTVHPAYDSCPAVNEHLYNDNTGSSTLELDGYLDVMTARSTVTPCETYRLKIVIADVGARTNGNVSKQNDSVIFLEHSSLSSNGKMTERATSNQSGVIQEGCADAQIILELPAPLTSTHVANYTVGGTAIENMDYGLSTSGFLSIPAGSTTGGITITPTLDTDNTEGQEDFWIALEVNCEPDTFYFTIEDNIGVMPDLGRDTTICVGDSIQLYPSYLPVIPSPQVFRNDTDVEIVNAVLITNPSGLHIESAVSSLEVSGAIPEVLGPGVIQSVCLDIDHYHVGHLNVFLRAPGGAFIKLTTNNGGAHNGMDNLCFVPDTTAELISNPGEVRDIYVSPTITFPQDTLDGNFQPEGDWSDLWADGSSTNGTWELIVFDDDALSFSLAEWIRSFEITFNPPYTEEYSYDNQADLSCVGCADPWAKPATTTTYELTVSDSNGCTRTDEITVSVISDVAPPVASCSYPSPDEILVTWDRSPGADDYEISADILSIPVLGSEADTAHLFTGLDPGQVLDITISPTVKAGSNCIPRDTSFQCIVPECETIPIILNSANPPLCFGGNDGSLSVIVDGLTSSDVVGYSIPFADPADSRFSNTGNFGLLESGSYNVVVDLNGCFDTLAVTLPDQPLLVTSMMKLNDPLCSGTATGSARVEVTGGALAGTYDYLWSNDSTTATINNAVAGKYYVTVTDDNNCSMVDSIEFIDPASFTITVSKTDISCHGAMDGTGTAIGSGGVEPFTYLWSNTAGSQMNSIATNLPPGVHSVIVSDGNQCPQRDSVEILEKDTIQVTIVTIDATCNGVDDGQASVTQVLGGAGGYEYLWNDADMSTTTEIINVAVGDVIVTVTDDDGCSVTETASVLSPPAMVLSIMDTMAVVCSGGNNGQATVVASGGDGNYMYEWSDGGLTSNMRTDLPSGSNTVTVTDGNGCMESQQFFLRSENPITSSIDSIAVSCFGGNDGSVILTAAGGTGTLNFIWDDPDASTTASVSNLEAGRYRVTISDVNSCFIVDSVDVTQPDKIQLSASITDIDCNGNNNGQATINVDNGLTIDSYSWNDPMSQFNQTANDLSEGSYRVLVIYNGVCLDSLDVEIMEPDPIIITMSKTDIMCGSDASGTATATPVGGVMPYRYVWNDMLNQTTSTAVNLSAQTYVVSVTDGNLCAATESVEVIKPALLEVGNKVASSVDCFDTATGMALFTPIGGIPPYTYAWSDGLSTDSLRTDLLAQMYIVTITDATLCAIVDTAIIGDKPKLTMVTDSTRVTCFGGDDGTASVVVSGGNGGPMYQWNDPISQTVSRANGLTAGTYQVVVRDALGCMDSTEVEVTQNDPIIIGGDVSDASCYGFIDGLADASASGGTGSLTYAWNDPANTMSSTLMNVPSGEYVVSVTDALSCTDTLRFIIGEPDSLAITFEIDGLLCFGDALGSITANATGGNGTLGDPSRYDYRWNDPLGQVTKEAEGLTVGLYEVSITDSRNCETVDTIRLIEPEALTLQLDSTDIFCNGALTGAINSTVTGGTLDYMYNYTGGITEADPGGLAAGVYALTVTDANGCQIMGETEINEPSAIDIVTMKEDIDCFGNQNGAINVTTTGGIIPYSFNWSSGESVEDVLNLSAGTYTLTVTDGNGCDQLSTVTIVSPSLIEPTINESPVACFGEMTGGATLSVIGGTMPYNLEWSTADTSAVISNLSAGTYYVTIEDNNGCEVTDTVNVTQPASGIMGTAMPVGLVCFGDENGTINLDVSGGTGRYQYQLNGQSISNNPIFQGLSGGVYEVAIIDQNGCTFNISDINVFEPNEISVDLGENKFIEIGIDTVQLNPSISGGQGGLTYEYFASNLDNLSCTDCPSPFIMGQVFTKEYTLTVTDQDGCSNQDNIIVVITKDREIWVPTGFTPNSGNMNDILVPLGDPNTKVINFQIFDRWGTLVFDQSEFQLGDTSFGWDGSYKGEALDSGVFVWKAEVVYFEDGIKENFTGQTYLLR